MHLNGNYSISGHCKITTSLNNNINQLNGKIFESLGLEEFHFVEKIHQNSNKKSFDLTKDRYIQKFEDLLISRNVGRHNANVITDKKKWVINISLRQLSQLLRCDRF